MSNFITTKMLDEARLKLGIKDYEGAKNMYTKIINANLARKLSLQNELPLFYRGLVNLKLKDYEEAIKDFSQAIEIDNKNDEIFFYRAIAKENAGDYKSALKDYNSSIKLNPLEEIYKSEKNRLIKLIKQKSDDFKKGHQKRKKEKILKSRSIFEKTKLIKKSFLNNFMNPEKEVVNLLFGIDNEEIFTVMEVSEILELNTKFVENIYSKALLIMDNGNFKNNLKSKNKVKESNEKIYIKSKEYDQNKEDKLQILDYSLLGKVNKFTKNKNAKSTEYDLKNGNEIETEDLSLIGKVKNPSKLNFTKLISIAFFTLVLPLIFFYKFKNEFKKNQNFANEVNKKEFKQIIKNKIIDDEDFSKKDQINFFKYGKNALIKKDFLVSKEYFSLLIKNDPSNHLAMHMRGVSKFHLKDYKGAIKDFSQAISLNEKSKISLNNRGIAKMSLKNYQGAINDFSKAIEIDNKYVNGFLSRGTANYKLENYRESLLDFDKAIEISPNDSEIYIGRSIVKEKTNDIKGACLDMKKASNLSIISQINKNWYKNNCQ